MEKNIHIYHINDLHSHFENWPKVVSFISQERKRLEQLGEEMIVVDMGDHLDRFHPITEATVGKANIRLMNELAIQYATIGNNEGITLSYEQLSNLYQEANFEILLCNLFEQDGTRPSWLKPYALYEMKIGIKIAFIGTTVSYPIYYEFLNWKTTDPFDEIPAIIDEVKEQGADIIVLLSHLGINDDERMAAAFNGIDIILGGHTHHLFPNGKLMDNTLLCAAGKFGMNVGHVMITLKENQFSAISTVHSVEHLKDDITTVNQIKSEEQKAINILNKKVVTLVDSLYVDWFETSPFPQLLAKALKEWCQAEIGMVNSGVILDSLPIGEVTIGDLHRICPHPINPCKVNLRGSELKEIVLQAATERLEKLELKGFGFRGKVLGKMVYDGLEVETKYLEDGIKHVSKITVMGEPIQLEREYSIATVDMFTFGSLYPELTHAPNKQYYLPEMLRDLLKWKLQ